MAEVFMVYDTPVVDGDHRYNARAIGREGSDGMWEGWLEFLPDGDATDVLVTGVESRQPLREHLVYWASGLSPVYLEGAFERARDPLRIEEPMVVVPFSGAPAPRRVVTRGAVLSGPEPVLDPFEIGARNLDVLRQELTALNRPRLLNIIAAFDLNPAGEDISWMIDRQLVHFICVAVETQMAMQSRVESRTQNAD